MNTITVCRNGLYREIPLLCEFESGIILGTGDKAQFKFNQEKFHQEFELRLYMFEGQWYLETVSNASLFQVGQDKDEDRTKEKSLILGEEQTIYGLETGKELFSIYLGILYENTFSDYNKRVYCNNINNFRIGGLSTSTIHILLPEVEEKEILFTKDNMGYHGVITHPGYRSQ